MKNLVFAVQNIPKTILASTSMGLLMLLLNACGTEIPANPAPTDQVQLTSVSDGANGGNPHFFWVTNRGVTVFPGAFDAVANPTVKICKLSGNVLAVPANCPTQLSGTQLTITPDNLAANPPIYGFYRTKLDAKTPQYALGDYRISVLVGGGNGQLLGYQDLSLVASSNDAKNPKAGFIAAVINSSVDLKFRVEVGASSPNIALTPSSLVFPSTFVGTASAAKTVTIKNVGVASLSLLSTTKTGANPNDFNITLGAGCALLAPQASCTASTNYAPTDLGSRNAIVTFRDNNGANLPQTLPLNGGSAPQVINNPPVAPHSIITFPTRDFVHGAGYLPTDKVTVTILRRRNDGTLAITGMVHDVIPQDDPGTPEFDGFVDVNHPGGRCWETIVPDIRIGDIARFETAPGVGDQTTVQNVFVTTPATIATPATPGNSDGVLTVIGVARNLDGTPMNLLNFEQRMIAKKNQFDFNGKRALRAGGAGKDGSLVFTAPGVFLATYNNLDQHDLDLAVQDGESRAVWLGAIPGALSELTIYEYGQFPGFAGGCVGAATGFAGPLAAPSPASLAFNIQALGVPSAPQTITLTNGGGASLNISSMTIDGTDANDFAIVPGSNCVGTPVVRLTGTCTVSVIFTPSAGGIRNANLNFIDDADNTPQIVTLGGNLNSVAPGPPRPFANPHNVFTFPSRDFVSSLGYAPNDRVKVEVLRAGVQVAVANNVVPRDDLGTPFFDGFVDVNHPGGACWEGTTPDLRAGDVVRETTNGGVVEDTTVQNVIITQPATQGRNADGTPNLTIIVKGMSFGTNGLQMPLNQFEARIIAKGSTFPVNGRRTLRAGGAGTNDGILTYDNPGNPANGNWTATFNLAGLSQADIDLAMSVETRNVWLGLIPGVLVESTIYEYGLGGGPVGCAAPLNSPVASFAPVSLEFAPTVVNIPSLSQSIVLSSTGAAPVNISRVYVAGIDPTEFTVNNGTCVIGVPIATGSTCTMSVVFTPGGLGRRTAAVQVIDNADGSPHSFLVGGQGVAAPPPNQAPTAGDDYVSTIAGMPVTVNVLNNDTDPNPADILTITGSQGGSNGSVTCQTGVANGTCTWTPGSPAFNGTTFFAYSISDGNGHTATATVTVTVGLPNAPTAAPDTDNTNGTNPVTTSVLGNDTGTSIGISSNTNGASGTVNCTNSTCTYTPTASPPINTSTFDTYNYTITDLFGRSVSSSVTVTVVGPVNQAPTANPDAANTIGNAAVTIDVLTNDTDPENQTLSIQSFTQAANGSVTQVGSSLLYSVNNDFSGTDSFSYTITDGFGGNSNAIVTITVNAPPPNAPDFNVSISITGGTISINVPGTNPGGVIVTNTSEISVNGILNNAIGVDGFDNTSTPNTISFTLTDPNQTLVVGDQIMFNYTLTGSGGSSIGHVLISVVP